MTKRMDDPQIDEAAPQPSSPHEPGVDLDRPVKGILELVMARTGSCYAVMTAHLNGQLMITALAREGRVIFPENTYLDQSSQVPVSMVRTCFEKDRALTRRDGFSHDPYFGEKSPASLLCRPLYSSATIRGVLYLESLEENAFGPQVLEELDAFLEDAATSLEHARMYAEMRLLNQSLQREIAERKKVEEELMQHRDRLEELVKARTTELEKAQIELVRKERLATLGQLIATVSHELRNPLGTVRGSVFIISQRLLGKDLGVERALDRAERNIVRCDRIIEDLLDYTRTQDLEFQPIHLDRWLEGALEEYLFPVDVKVQVRLGVNLELPMEPERLRRCLINLLNNACDAMKTKKGEETEREKRLEVVSRIKENRVEIRVSDSGVGIPAENLAKIFEPLFSTKSFGVGLGLPTVQQIMEQHGGSLEIESEVGVGTTAILWLPKPKPQEVTAG
ncbi:MAG: ATP-binding protein [Acidobacteriota bacterium]|nr:ATP-binding protein [Acidobacteriota bacterium]